MKKFKTILHTFGLRSRYKFAVKKTQLASGKEVLLPVVKLPGIFQEWAPIVKIYDRYYVAPDIDIDKEFDEVECMEHIEGYMKQLSTEDSTRVRKVTYDCELDYSTADESD